MATATLLTLLAFVVEETADDRHLSFTLKGPAKLIPDSCTSEAGGKGTRVVRLREQDTNPLYDLGEKTQLGDDVKVSDEDRPFLDWYKNFVPVAQGGVFEPDEPEASGSDPNEPEASEPEPEAEPEAAEPLPPYEPSRLVCALTTEELNKGYVGDKLPKIAAKSILEIGDAKMVVTAIEDNVYTLWELVPVEEYEGDVDVVPYKDIRQHRGAGDLTGAQVSVGRKKFAMLNGVTVTTESESEPKAAKKGKGKTAQAKAAKKAAPAKKAEPKKATKKATKKAEPKKATKKTVDNGQAAGVDAAIKALLDEVKGPVGKLVATCGRKIAKREIVRLLGQMTEGGDVATTAAKGGAPLFFVPGRVLKATKNHRDNGWGRCEYEVECQADGTYKLVGISGGRKDLKKGQVFKTGKALLQALTGKEKPGTMVYRYFGLE